MKTKKSIVLDPFVGAGTTINACIKLNRHFIGILEII
jgi:DNA modification methylase